MVKPKIYLAGPEVFLKNAVEIGVAKKALCERYGFEGLYPLDNEFELPLDWFAIFRANMALIEQAEYGIFNLTPFRGPSADVGTVFELGSMYGMGKTAIGYSNSSVAYKNRVHEDGMLIEDFGLPDNLMISGALIDYKLNNQIVGTTEISRLDNFEACLQTLSLHY